MRGSIVILLLATAVPAVATEALPPRTWPVAFDEVYQLGPREGTQLPFEEDALVVRHFHLRVESSTEIEVKVTRAYESNALWSERRTSDVSVVIPWGRGERGTISLFNHLQVDVRIRVALATDPDHDGLPVHSYYVNRFLELLEDDDREGALGLLDRALVQDSQDTVAARLVERVTGLQGTVAEIVDARAVQRRAERIDELRAARDAGAIDDSITDAPDLTTDLGRRRWNLLVAGEHVRREAFVLALQAYYRALDAAPGVAARFEVYPGLIAANRAVGNEQQADAIVDRALGEAPDDAARARVEQWRGPEH